MEKLKQITIGEEILREREKWYNLRHNSLAQNSSVQELIDALRKHKLTKRYDINALIEITGYSQDFIKKALGIE